MRFQPLSLPGALRVSMEPQEDERGFFARSVCAREFAAHGLPPTFVQSSVSWNRRLGTVRGLHFQWPPAREGKLVRCLRGAIFDVLLDLRPERPTFLRHCAVPLDAQNRDALFIPPGMAHGFQTLTDDAEVLYQMSDFHAPALAGGVRWDDPAFGIEWPIAAEVLIAPRDASYPDFDAREFTAELARRTAAAPRGADG
jgi:dTDP-4-dehydrorhamnose 3,5-epimerase